jgi:RNA polymerase subunit RPABC4/transcription elongation factor Spt4
MKPPKKRQKLCQNCDGEVDLDVIFCPYCGSDLLEEKKVNLAVEEVEKVAASKQGKIHYPPPYTASKTTPLSFAKEEEEETAVEPPQQKSQIVPKSPFWAVLLVTLGAQALLLGVLLFIFSEGGAVHLRFDAKMWLFYVIFSMPMLYFGWKSVSQLD